MNGYVPLNVRSSYSIGDSICTVPRLVRKARQMGLPAIALVDTNMCGAREFHEACHSTRLDYGGFSSIKPIIGLSVRIKERGIDAPLVLLAKNKTGYRNIVRLASENSVLGRTGELVVPLDSVLKMNAGVICLAGNNDLDLASACFSPFCGDFAFMAENDDEVFPDWKIVNVCAMPPVRFLNKDDAEAYDVYCAISDGRKSADAGCRHCSGDEYLMSGEEMSLRFPKHPEWIENTAELADQIEDYEICEVQEVIEFPLPHGFGNEADYLASLVCEGMKKRWGDPVPPKIAERIDFELNVITKMGFPSYFLVVHDYVEAARRMGVWVGPARGAATGSAVAYALGITSVDPIRHGLLFERFLNLDRIAMPDIDIDFEDAGRGKVVEYLCGKYGRDHVAHIVTFEQMAPRRAIRDVARVLEYPIRKANELAELVPEEPRMTFSRALNGSDKFRQVYENGDDAQKKILRLAGKIEGCVRDPGIHACGIVISRNPLPETLPVMAIDANSRVAGGLELVTQYDGRHVEPAGLVRFDILGLRTLAIHKGCLNLIKEQKGQAVDLDKIPYDEPETMAVFARGDTENVFPFEPAEMKRWLMALKPKCLGDLAAMCALYYPGSMEYIPAFVRRKNGEEPVVCDHPLMEEVLRETYGITVYQEQIMVLSRKLGGFTRGESDSLRRAMGKKRLDIKEEKKAKFTGGCLANPEFRVGKWKDECEARRLIDRIWDDWCAVASYAFNKSHAVAYAWLAYQTAYLKTHYPREFLFALMQEETGNRTRLRELIEEAQSMGITFTQEELDMVQYGHAR